MTRTRVSRSVIRVPFLLPGLLLHALVLGAPAAVAADGNVDLPRYPSISPDGAQVVFSWRGDLWKVPAVGGKAARLTSHPEHRHSSRG